ncbi:MAG: GNAT family N-acetyltransferase [Croceibacterium sp.]
MIVEATASDFDALIAGVGPRGLKLVPDSPIAPVAVLQMLANLAATIREQFSPAAWLIVDAGEVVGLCSVVRVPERGDMHIGYGVADARQGHGHATRAVADLVARAKADPRVAQVSAETGVDNLPSQQVLVRNGFEQTGRRIDEEDGPVFTWLIRTG